MIRNVVLGRLANTSDGERAEADRRADAALAGIAALQLPGQLSMTVGRDAGLRAGAWSFAITNEWADVETYRAYDADPEHNEYRAVLAGLCADLARVQVELPDAT